MAAAEWVRATVLLVQGFSDHHQLSSTHTHSIGMYHAHTCCTHIPHECRHHVHACVRASAFLSRGDATPNNMLYGVRTYRQHLLRRTRKRQPQLHTHVHACMQRHAYIYMHAWIRMYMHAGTHAACARAGIRV